MLSSRRARRLGAPLCRAPPCGAGYFAPGGKVTKTPPGTAQNGHSVSIFAHPTPSGPSGHLPLIGGVGPGPHYGGRAPVRGSRISGAQNLSGFLPFNPGHWALGVQKFPLVRFHACAWFPQPKGLMQNLTKGMTTWRAVLGGHPRRGGTLGRPPSLPLRGRTIPSDGKNA